MKRLLLLLMISALGTFSYGQMYNVTFSVDMSEYPGSFTTPFVAGSFEGWTGIAMSNTSGDIWEVTVPISDGTYEYKIQLDGWVDQENFLPGTPCTVSDGGYTNRVFTVAGADLTEGTFCWNSCDACGAGPAGGNVTFSVDMSEFSESFTTVYVSGSINGWDGLANPMTDMGSGIWETTIALTGGPIEYKFTTDNWTHQENFAPGGSCTTTNGGFTNRAYTVDGDATIQTFCWNSCDACGATGSMANVTLQVDMSEYASPFTTVHVFGSFNGWSPDANELTDMGGGIWATTLTLAPGTYEYKFRVDGVTGPEETLTPGTPCTMTTDVFTNRVINVTVDETVPVVCWESCDACGGGSQANVTFQVDMSEYASPFTTVHIFGSFNGWSPDANELTDMGGGIWATTLLLDAGTYEYKFRVDGVTGPEETLTPGTPCTMTTDVFTNRVITVSADETVPVVCWESCDACGGGSQANVTFQVDMSEYANPFTTVHIFGSFNGWSPDANELTDMGGGVWATTLLLDAGTYEYKFRVDGVTGPEETLTPGSSCTMTTDVFTNRVITVSADETVPVVCWESCDACGGSDPANVTFQVNMSEYDGDPFTSVNVFGSFNGWNPTANPMNDMGGGLWTVTLPLDPATYEYKFVLDGGSGAEETFTAGDPCTMTTDVFTNRVITITADVTLPEVCWESCDACQPISTLNLIEDKGIFTIMPTVVDQQTQLFFNDLTENKEVSIYNTVGQRVQLTYFDAAVPNATLQTANLADGVYIVAVRLENAIQVEKIVISH